MGEDKELKIHYIYQGVNKNISISDKDTLRIPASAGEMITGTTYILLK
jgi:hypothetical protein